MVPAQDEYYYEPEDFMPVKRLGYGDMGTVFLATLRNTGEPYAMKVMNKEVVKTKRSEYRVDRELQILSCLDHPFLPRLFTHFESKKQLYLVTDYCPGGDMNMLRQRQPEKKFSENAARFYAAEVLLAIEYLHKIGVIYRDLKPENVLIREDGHIMVTDFDLSLKVEKQEPTSTKSSKTLSKNKSDKSRRSKTPFMCGGPASLDIICATTRAVEVNQCHKMIPSRKTKKVFPSEKKNPAPTDGVMVKSQSFVGTEEYVAPEMIRGSGHGMALDWWTFGVFLYEMIYGVTPFKGKNQRGTFDNVLFQQPCFPGDWTPAVDLISKLLVKDPTKRLGYAGGAEEIKSHYFFEGVAWDSIGMVARPPWVPQPLSPEDLAGTELVIEENLKQQVERVKEEAVVKAEEEPVTDDARSSSDSSTVLDELSDVEPDGMFQQQSRRRRQPVMFHEF